MVAKSQALEPDRLGSDFSSVVCRETLNQFLASAFCPLCNEITAPGSGFLQGLPELPHSKSF